MHLPDFLIDNAGEIDVAGHRIGLYSLVEAHAGGFSPERIREEFPTLPLEVIQKVLAFHAANRAEVDGYVARYRDDLDRMEADARAGACGPSRADLLRRRQSRQAGVA